MKESMLTVLCRLLTAMFIGGTSIGRLATDTHHDRLKASVDGALVVLSMVMAADVGRRR